MVLLSLKNVSLRYGEHPLLDNVEFQIGRGERVCLLGANGTGKTSMLRLLAGEIQPDSGQVTRASGARVTSLAQQVPRDRAGRVMDIVLPKTGAPGVHAHEVAMALTRLHLDPEAGFATLSGGTQRRVFLAKALVGSPDLVLLDEPTNHLDVDSIALLEAYLLRYTPTFLFVTHDRAFLRRLATRIVELDRGRLSDWRCDYDTFLVRKEEALHAEAREWERMDQRLEKEEEWRRQGVKARTVRNQGRLRALEALRATRSRRRERGGSVRMAIQEADRTGDIVLKAERVSFGFAGAPMIRDFSAVLARGDKVGILGPNGCGKTTLVRLLLGGGSPEDRLEPRSGRITRGANLKIAYSDQFRAQLDDDKTLAANVADDQDFVTLDGQTRHIIGYLQDFLFTRDRIRQPVRSLSGGERNRLLLARLFAQPSNVLVLDEPTNDLDLDTLELLENQLAGYRGTALIISHDREFLNNTVTGVWAFEKHPPDLPCRWLCDGDGWYVNEYVGGYDDWEEIRQLPPVPQAPAREKAPPATEAVRAPRKLTWQDRRDLEALPARIEALEAEQTQLHVRLADPAFYRKNGQEIAEAGRRVAALAAELDESYRRWDALASISGRTRQAPE